MPTKCLLSLCLVGQDLRGAWSGASDHALLGKQLQELTRRGNWDKVDVLNEAENRMVMISLLGTLLE